MTGALRIEALPEWALAPREAEVTALLARCFGPGFGGRSFHAQRHHLRLLALDAGPGGALLGHVAVLWRTVRLGEAPLEVAGLAEIATAPERRGEGIARALVLRAVEEARASQAAFVLLFGVAGLYAGLGFRPAANPIRHVVLGGGRTLAEDEARGEPLMALPLRREAWDEAAPLDLLGPMF